MALALLILYVRVFPVEVIRTGNAGIIFFGYGTFHASGPPTWITLPIVFLAVAAVMATIGEGVARTFIRFRPLDAYRLDIAGSIAGIAAFSLLSFLDAKPVVWALIVALVMLLLYGRRAGLLQVVAVVAIVLLLWSESLSSSDIWSPYYRISVHCERPRASVRRQRQRDPAPEHHPGPRAAEGLLPAVPGRSREPAEQRPDRRRRDRRRRGQRPAARAPSTSTRWRSIPSSTSWAGG